MARVSIILGPQFEDAEFRVPYDELRSAGHEVTVLGVTAGEVMEGKRGEERVRVEASVIDRAVDQFDALVIPGGYAPDHLRTDGALVGFVRRFVDSGKLVAAICHGPQLLIEADAVAGKTMTSWPSVKTDLMNAGARWVDREVVLDGAFITSRKPDDLEAFTRAIVTALSTSTTWGAAALPLPANGRRRPRFEVS